MRISVIGCGYLGAVHAAALASLGHDVVGIDVDEAKVEALAAGRPPFHEPGLADLLNDTTVRAHLTVTTDIEAARGAEVHFVCVGTPQRADSPGADLTYVDAAFNALAAVVGPGEVVVGKSTVPVGTAAGLALRLRASAPDVHLAWNPEFLREGFAVQDTLTPDRLVYGVATGGTDDPAVAALDSVYAHTIAHGTPRLVVDYPTSELVKVAANSFLATKISFINAMAELCEATGGDVTHLADAIGHDARIGRRFLNAGLGFGGGCLPKDIRAFMARADELGAGQAVSFLAEVDAINTRRREHVVRLTEDVLGEQTVAGARVAVLGAAFKPDSDDIRDSPALDVADKLHARGAHVVVTDPKAIHNARLRSPRLSFEDDVKAAVTDADVVLLLTEWREYRDLDPSWLGEIVGHRRIIDGRNVLDPAIWRAQGWTYRGLGRP